MKKIILVLTLCSFALASFGQVAPDTTLTKNFHLQKSLKQKRAGRAFLISGSALLILTAITNGGSQGQEVSWAPDLPDNMGLIMVGYGACIASIPFFISAGYHTRKAARISFSQQPVWVPGHHAFRMYRQPGVSVQIGL